MATYKSVNKSTNIVSVGRTAPVGRGQTTADNSLPVVLASDAGAIPVAETNKIASEVALSLLGIPRSEVALGIFADVNTYDVNPSEWSIKPLDKRQFTGTSEASSIRPFIYHKTTNQPEIDTNNYNWGLTHVPEEAGAMIEAPPGESAVLTSKRFFRYQPGRVSSATFGIKSSAMKDLLPDPEARNVAVRKYGIYDKYDGYYWETRQTGRGDEFAVSRRTQSIIDFRNRHEEFTSDDEYPNNQTVDYGIVGKGKEITEVRESIMKLATAYTSGNSEIIIENAYVDNSVSATFKDSVIPRVGMTIRNITVNSPHTQLFGDDENDYGFYVADTDASPLFRESTVITSVTRTGDNLVLGINNRPVSGSVSSFTANVSSSINSGNETSNGRLEQDFGTFSSTGDVLTDVDGTQVGHRRKKLKFSFAGENILIRDNLPLLQAAVYDPSLMKERTEYNILKASTTGEIYFNLPISAQGNEDVTDADTRTRLSTNATAFDDSPLGLYVHNVFSFGQIVEYTTDATNLSDAAGSAYLGQDDKNIFIIDKIDCAKNSIRLKHLPSRSNGGVSGPAAGVDLFTNANAMSEASNGETSHDSGGIRTKHFIKTPVPFMFPEVEYNDVSNTNVSDLMFPYTRDFTVFSGDANQPQTQLQTTQGTNTHRSDGQIGCLNTNLASDTGGELATLNAIKFETYKSEINDINNGLACGMMGQGRTFRPTESFSDTSRSYKASGWRYWVDDNVDPEYWGVYEYKVPRSRFSFESLNGNGAENNFYSDVVKDGGIFKYPGQQFGTTNNRDSVWDIDFANVIMKKIEFSWYGAVGALFLAYVPSSVGEARWVRVHHLRCSNQLKTASLGNATLPLTYTVFGGGVPKQYGSGSSSSGVASIRNTGYASGLSASEFITKYGSSYYIDGGDRGTVRLFNYAENAPSRVSTSRLSDERIKTAGADVDISAGTSQPISLASDGGSYQSNTFSLRAHTIAGAHSRQDLYVGSTVTFGNSQNTARVVHVERVGPRPFVGDAGIRARREDSPGLCTVTLDRVMTIDSPVHFLIDNPYTIFGIKSKTSIQSSQDFLVRNRVQVYPTKISVGMQTPGGQTGTTSITLQKNVLFQSNTIFDIFDADENPTVITGKKRYNDIKFTGTSDEALKLAGSGLPTRLSFSNVSPNNNNLTGTILPGDTNAGPYYAGAKVGDNFYGWARVTNKTSDFTLFGKMEVVKLGSTKNSPIYDFIPSDSYTGDAFFKEGSYFTHAYQYFNELGAAEGETAGFGSGISGQTADAIDSSEKGKVKSKAAASLIDADVTQIERLSSIQIVNETRRPIPGTGSKVASFFLKDGSDYFDLQPYFDYNKDYISFPLTNIPDNLFIGAQFQEALPGANGGASPRVAVSLTWEEQ